MEAHVVRLQRELTTSLGLSRGHAYQLMMEVESSLCGVLVLAEEILQYFGLEKLFILRGWAASTPLIENRPVK